MSTQSSDDGNDRVAGIVAAEVAVSEGDYHRAEEGLLKALSEVRRKKSEAAHADD